MKYNGNFFNLNCSLHEIIKSHEKLAQLNHFCQSNEALKLDTASEAVLEEIRVNRFYIARPAPFLSIFNNERVKSKT